MTKPIRCPSIVATEIREVVPEEHKERFTRLISDFSYKAPEQVRECWIRLSSLCNELVPNGLIESWQVRMINILTYR